CRPRPPRATPCPYTTLFRSTDLDGIALLPALLVIATVPRARQHARANHRVNRVRCFIDRLLGWAARRRMADADSTLRSPCAAERPVRSITGGWTQCYGPVGTRRVSRIAAVMLKDVDQPPERIAYVEATHAPRLPDRTVLDGDARGLDPAQRLGQV